MCRLVGEYISLELFCCAAMTAYLSAPCSTGGRRTGALQILPTSSVFPRSLPITNGICQLDRIENRHARFLMYLQ